MIFAELQPGYINSNDRSILARMETFYANSISVFQSWVNESDLDTRFWAGDQSAWESFYGPIPNTRRQFIFNHIKSNINTPTGYQRQHRKSFIAQPVENGDDATASQYTKCFKYTNNREHLDELVSDCFEGALVTGMNFIHVYMDFQNDPISGDIKFARRPYNTILFDPFMRNPDMSDCNAVWDRSYVTRREAMALMPEHAEEIAGLFGKSYVGSRDGKFSFMPENFSANRGAENLMAYDLYSYRDYREAEVIYDVQSGECMEWTGKDQEWLNRTLRKYPQLKMINQEKPTVRNSIVLNGKCFYDGPQIDGCDSYAYVPVYSYWHPEIPYYNVRLAGLVRGMRDCQYLFNRFMVIISDIFESQVTSGWLYHPDDLIDPNAPFKTGQGQGMPVKKGMPLNEAAQKIMTADVPQGLFQHVANFAKEFNMITGINEEMAGSATQDVAGVLTMLRTAASLVNMQGIFDKLDLSIEILGQRIMDRMTANYTPGKIKNILEGEEPAPQFYSEAFGKYSVVVTEGMNSVTQQQMQLAQMLELRQAGINLPDKYYIEACSFQNKTKILEDMEKQAQAQQQTQQQQDQLTLQETQARIKFTESSADAQKGTAIERVSRVQENIGLAEERKAAAVRDEDIAMLNLVRAAKELETLDISHLKELIALAQQVKEHEHLLQDRKMQMTAAAMQQATEQPQQQASPEQSSPEQSSPDQSAPVQPMSNGAANEQVA